MNMILHNLKVAFRNLEKYKLQTLISVLSIAVGILTISLAHSYLRSVKLNALYDLPFIERTYNVTFKECISGEDANINMDIIRALKGDNGPKSAEQVVVPISGMYGASVEFNLPDSTVRRGTVSSECIDPDYLTFAGFRSAITGQPITELKRGEAIIGERLAKKIFHDKSPIGSIQEQTGPVQPVPVRIVDVYKSIYTVGTYMDRRVDIRDELLFSLADRVIDQEEAMFFLIPWIHVVIKEGATEQQLTKEINELVKPFGVEARIVRTLDKREVSSYYSYKTLIYIISSLILMAAIIGFLRTQIQLFRMRRGEISLRIVNGAYRRELFMMLASEPFIIIGMAVLIAVLLGFPLQEFFISNRMNIIRYEDISISRLWLYSIEIGALLLVIVSLITWFTLNRICNANDGLAANMRRSRSHIFRNVMLGFQLAVSLIFVCCTLILVNTGRNMLKNCNIPEKDDLYAQCLFLNTRYMYTHSIDDEERIERVCAEIRRLPEVDRLELYCSSNDFDILELKNNPDAMAKMDNQSHFQCISTTDKDLPSFFGMEVEWFPGNNVDRDECILIGEELYRRLKDAGVLNGNTLSSFCGGPRYMISLPVGGIIKNIPYTTKLDQIVAITPYWKENYMNMTYVVIPIEGRGKGLDKKIGQLLLTTAPENISNESMISNYRDMINWIPGAVKAVYVACLVLGSVSLLICAMSIFSAIALDTRGRRKEVAIRKVNGAKNRDICLMFGRVYVVLLLLALIIAVPVCVCFCGYVNELEIVSLPYYATPYLPIITGILIEILLVLLIVYWQIRKLLKTDTSTIISKE